ncbi:MAG: DUF4870 domain-containing protein [Verrucomicrobiota bacterium]
MNETTPSSPTPPPPEEYSSAPGPSAPPPPPAPIAAGGMDGKQWAMLLHLSQLAGVVVPGLGLAAPIIIWQVKKEQFPELDPHGKMVTNWIISLLIYCVAATLLSVVTCGFGALLFIPVAVVAIIFPILGGLKARDGILWKYPITITFLK